jgi:hypothetical protein
MAIEDLTPFGTAPKFYEGLLGADETAALQKRAQIQGLLGAGLALAQGMSRSGAPRSALQNILGAAVGGFQGAGGAYQQGLQNYQTQQQLEQLKIKQQQTRNQMTGIANAKTKYPDLAPLADIDPQEFVKAVAAREETKRARERMSAYEQIGAPQNVPSQQQVSPAVATSNIPIYGDLGEYPSNAINLQQPPQQVTQPPVSQLEQNKQQAALFRQKQQAALLNKDTEAAKYFGDRAEELFPKASFMRVGDELIYAAGGDFNPVYKTKPKAEEFTGNLGNLSLRYFKTKNPADLDANQLNFLDTKARELGIGEGQKVVTNVYTGQLSKGTATEVEKEQLSISDQIANLNNIKLSFRPEFLKPQYRIAQDWTALKDKLSSKGLNETEKYSLGQYTEFRQNTVKNLNATIKAITGAAMGADETVRIRAQVPDAGDGVLSGDSPTQFESKLNNITKDLTYALARKEYALRKGLNWKDIPLDQIPKIMDKRGSEIARGLGLDPEKLDREAKKGDPKAIEQRRSIQNSVLSEFGISN